MAENLIDRAAAAGFRAIVLTVDQPVYGSSPRAARAPLARRRPTSATPICRASPIAQNSYKAGLHAARVTFPATWRDLEWLVRRSPVDVVVKGVLRGDDAVRCVDAGAKAIIVSNHGGRHLDATVATADALREIADAVARQARSSMSTAASAAAPTSSRHSRSAPARCWSHARRSGGLRSTDADGVRAVLDHLRAELVRTMALCGAARLDQISQ